MSQSRPPLPEVLGERERGHLRTAVLQAHGSFAAALAAYRAVTGESARFISEPTPPQLRRDIFSHGRVVAARDDYLRALGDVDTAVEVGTDQGKWARVLVERLHPAKLIIMDIKFKRFDVEWFQPYIDDGRVELRQGNSWELLHDLPDASVDFLYIDASHQYDDVKRDAEEAHKKVTRGGHIAFNDYMNWSYLEGMPYGVMAAANELANSGEYDVVCFAINNGGYSDLVLRRR